MASSDRAMDFVAVVNDLRARMARVEALGAARYGSPVSQQLPLDATSATERQILLHAAASFTTDGSGNHTVTFTTPFPTACDGVIWQHGVNPISIAFILSVSTTGFSIGMRNTAGAAITGTVFAGYWLAWGH